MPLSCSPRARLLGILGLALAACDGSESGSDTPDGGYETSDSSVGAVECDGQPVGAVETRTRYQSAAVPPDGSCMPQTQTQSCGADGAWTEWSGDYTAETCVVDSFDSCDDQPHGTEQTRERYELPSVPFGTMCNKQTQARSCEDGSWSDWDGEFEAETCVVEGAASCDDKPHGTEEERTRFESVEVPFGSECRTEQQTRSCSNGTWSTWTGSFTSENCRVLGALSCGNVPHGGEEPRTRWEASLVPAGQECKSEEQQRTCSNGVWGAWSGTFAAELCDVEGQRRCGQVPHGTEVARRRYESASVPYGSECVAENQTSTCNDGTLGEYSGTFTFEACEPLPPADCPPHEPHGTELTRVRFEADTVAFGQTCVSETQARLCDNGDWTAWSGTFTFELCTVAPPPPCEGGDHGSQQTRQRFQAAVVPFGTLCVQEEQARSCSAGSWSEWIGTFTSETCAVEEPRPCEDNGATFVHGAPQTRQRFQAATVPFEASCVAESQTRTCSNGSWGAWSGSFAAESCDVLPPRDCAGGAHGTSRQRERFAEALVPQGSTCQSEMQTSVCHDGSWGAWTGTFTAESCRARGRSCNDGTTVVVDGDQQSRTRYAEAFPSGSCREGAQTRQCNDGTFSAWTGTYTMQGCGPLPAPEANVASCRISQGDLAQCIEYRGTIDLSVYQSGCASGTWDATRGCPTGGSAYGKCTYGLGIVTQSGFHYAVLPSLDMRATCMQTGGTWTEL
jgi:hypothetical protein